MLNWLINTDAGLACRIAIGVCIFIALALIDLRRNGRAATRWREYAFLLIAVVAAIAYGAINDQITSAISWEYFYYAKDLYKILGPTTPPDMRALHWQAAIVGAKATWTAGLIIGVALLLANNPMRDRPRLRNRQLLIYIPLIFLICVAFGVCFGFFGREGWLNFLSADFQDMARADIFRPRRFMTTWGVHLGGYVGGGVGTALAIRKIFSDRSARIPQNPGG